MGQCVLTFSLTLQGQEHIWYLDSGCSRHMTGFKSLLDDYVKKDGPTVTYGDNSKGQTKGLDPGMLSSVSDTLHSG